MFFLHLVGTVFTYGVYFDRRQFLGTELGFFRYLDAFGRRAVRFRVRLNSAFKCQGRDEQDGRDQRVTDDRTTRYVNALHVVGRVGCKAGDQIYRHGAINGGFVKVCGALETVPFAKTYRTSDVRVAGRPLGYYGYGFSNHGLNDHFHCASGEREDDDHYVFNYSFGDYSFGGFLRNVGHR